MSSGEALSVGDTVWPGGCFVVAGAGFDAAVDDADEAVAELAERGVVAEPAGTLPVVVGAGSRGCRQGGEGLRLQGVGEPLVADEPGQDDFAAAGRAGDGAGPGVVFAGFGGGVAAGGVSELGKHPGAVD